MLSATKDAVFLKEYDPLRDGELTTFSGIEGCEEIERYWVNEPYVFIAILYNTDIKEYLYYAVEPTLTKFQKSLLEKIYEDLLDILTLEEDKNKEIR